MFKKLYISIAHSAIHDDDQINGFILNSYSICFIHVLFMFFVCVLFSEGNVFTHMRLGLLTGYAGLIIKNIK